MTAKTSDTSGVQVLGPKEGEIKGPPDGTSGRFMIDGRDSGGSFALVEHRLAPRVLAAPLHLRTREDEFSYVLEGRVGALRGEQEAFGQAGDLIFMPRGQWHTFWNAGDVPARVLEIISPEGLEELFRLLWDGLDPATLAALESRYGCEVNYELTGPLVERHGLTFSRTR